MNYRKLIAPVLIATAVLGAGSPVFAAKGDYGVDNAVYQGAYGKFGYAKDKFMISQIGGYTGFGTYDQSTYATQVQSAIAQGKRAHTYVWWQNITDYATADAVLDHFLPKVQTPKGSIVALDIESGGQNTDVIMHALAKIKASGYTPMVYGYKNYLVQNTDLNRIADKYELWLAEYPNYQVTPEPNYNYFPSFKNVGIFQFTSTYVAGGLDGNIDLSGVTDNGYKKGDADKPKTDTPAIDKGQKADDTDKSDIKVGDTVKVNYPSGASNWAALEVENINGNTATQTLKDSNSQVFIRSMGGNPAKWSAWRNVSDPGDPWQVVATAHFEAPKINSTSAGSIVYYKFGSMVLADFHRENVTFSADIDTSLNNDVTIVVDSGTIPPKDANEWMAVPIAANKVGVGVDAQARGTTLIRVRAIDGPMTPGTYVKMGTIMYHTNS